MMAIVWTWTPERVEELRGLWEQGLTINEIGARFGIGRGAVIGKVRRHGFVRAGQPAREPYKRGVRTAEERAARKKAANARMREVMNVEPDPDLITVKIHKMANVLGPVVPEERRPVPIMKLRGWHCRFIVQEVGETLYCGEPALAGGSWCAEHRARCFQQRSSAAAGDIQT